MTITSGVQPTKRAAIRIADIGQAFADSINAVSTANGCYPTGLNAHDSTTAGVTTLYINAAGNEPFDLYVGPVCNPNCLVVGTLGSAGCPFNPTIYHMPLPGIDCDEDGYDDVVGIALGLSEDFDGDGVPDACEVLRGDYDDDGDVDLVDFAQFQLCYTGISGGPVDGVCDAGDFDDDGDIDLADFAYFQLAFTGS